MNRVPYASTCSGLASSLQVTCDKGVRIVRATPRTGLSRVCVRCKKACCCWTSLLDFAVVRVVVCRSGAGGRCECVLGDLEELKQTRGAGGYL